MTRLELAQKIKDKHPAYQAMADDELVDKILAKYPVYAGQITDGFDTEESDINQTEIKKVEDELKPEKQPPVEEKKDPLSNIEQLENQLTELKSKKETIQPGQEKYDLGMSIKRLEDQIDEAKEKMFYGEPDVNNSFTLVDQTEDTFKRVMNEANIPVEFTGTIGNEIQYIDPITRETKKIDLRPFGYQNKLKVARQIDELKDSFKKLSSEEAFKNTVSTIGNMNSVYSMNDALNRTDYEIKEVVRPGSAVLGFSGVKDYVVYKDGKAVTEKLNKTDLSNYLNKNLKQEDIDIVGENLSKTTSDFEKLKQDRKEFERKRLDDSELSEEFVRGKDFSSLLKSQLVDPRLLGAMTEEQGEKFKDYVDNFDGKGEFVTVTERDPEGVVITRKVQKQLPKDKYVQEKIKYIKDYLEENKNNFKKDIPEGFVDKIFATNYNNFKKIKLDEKMVTISEQLLKDSGNQDLLQLSYRFNKDQEKEYKENINKLKDLQKDYVSLLTNNNVKPLLEKISKSAPKGTTINIPSITEEAPDGSVISTDYIYDIKKPNRKLNKEEEEKFKQAKADLFLLYQNQKNLQKNYELDVSKTLDDIKKYEEKKQNRKISQQEIFDIAFKEYGIGSVLANDFNTAVGGLALSIPTLFGSDWAVEEQRRINNRQKSYETPLTHEQAYDQGRIGSFVSRTLSQQTPNILLAVGTAGAGNALNLSTLATKIAVGTTFGVSSGADKFRNLELGRELVDVAKNQKEQIQSAYDLGMIDDNTYNKSMLEANKTIAMSDLTDDQIKGAAVATGIIEGGITSFIGTAPNSIKVIKDFTKGGVGFKDFLYKKGWQKFGLAGKELGKRTGGEIIEEEAIYFGDQIASEGLILGRDMNFDQVDDVAVATIITAGAMNGPGVAYSSILNNTASKKFEKDINKVVKDIEGLSLVAQSADYDQNTKNVAISAMSDKIKQLSDITNGLEVEAIALGAENQKKLFAFNAIENSILSEADVKPTDSEQVKKEKIKIYQDNLIQDGKRNKAEEFNQKLKSIQDEKETILKDVNYNRVEEALGERGKNIADRLQRYNKGDYRNKTKSEKLAQVIQEIRDEVVQDNIIRAKSNPQIVEQVESLRTKKGKPVSERTKNKVYAQEGEKILFQQGRALALNENVGVNADIIVDNINDLDILQFESIEQADDILTKEVNKKDSKITNEIKNKILNNLKEKGNGFIVGNKYIVKDKKLAEKRLLDGKLLPGTALMHEINHAIDDRIFITPESKKKYAEGVYKYVNSQGGYLSAVSEGIIQSLEQQLFPEDAGKKFEDKSEKFKDEYTKVLQETLYASEDVLKLEKEEGFKEKLEAFLGRNLKVETPKQAFDYMISNNSAFRQGKISKKTQKRLAKAPEIPKSVKSSIKPSRLGFVIDETPAERKKRQDKRNVDVYKVYQDFAKGKTKEEWNEFLNTNRGDAVFGKMLEDYSIDMYAIAISKRAEDPILATSEAIEPLMNHIRAFNPLKNKDLPGYIGGYLGLKTGTGIERTAKKIKDISLEQEGVRRVAEKQAEKEIEPQVEEKLRDKRSFVELDILNDKIKKDINSKILSNLYKLAIRGDLSIDQVISKIEETIQKDISKDLISIFGPKSIAQDSKTKEVIISDTYKQALRVNYKNIIKSIPVDVIKKKYNKLFKLKEIGREDIKKVTEEGKVTYYRKAMFDISEPGLDNFVNFFTEGGYTTLRARQRSMVDNIAKELAAISLFSLNVQEDSLSDLFEGSDTETQEKVLEFVFKNAAKNIKDFLTREVGEQRSMDIVKFSSDLNIQDLESLLNNSDSLIKEINKLEGNLTSTSLKGILYKIFLNNKNITEFEGDEGIKKLDNLSKKILNPIRKYLNKIETVKNIPVKNFIIEQVNLNEIDTNLKKFLNLKIKSFSDAFGNGEINENIATQRNLEYKYINHLVNKFGKAKAIEIALTVLKGHNVTSGKIGGNRSQIFKGMPDYIDNHLNQIPGVVIEHKLSKGKTPKTIITKISVDNKEIKLPKAQPSQSSKTKQAFENEYDERVKSADQAWNTLIDYLDFMHSNGNALSFGMTMMSLKSNMASMLKAAAPAEYYYVGDQIALNKLRYEHIIPTEYIVMRLTQNYFGNKVDLNALKNKYKVAIIPQIMDDNINIQFQKTMPFGWNEDISEVERYYNDKTLGYDNMYAIEVLGGKNKGDIIGENYIRLNNDVVESKKINYKEIKNNAINVKDSKNVELNIDEVLSFAATVDESLKIARDPNAPIKKIRVFDFDDTLAKSKSKIFYTKPDGAEGELTAEEFAEKGADLVAEGAVMDFTDFNIVREGKRGPMFDIAKKIEAARGLEDVFVLTARAPESQQAIYEFLKSEGLEVPLKNIVGLGNSTGEAKANWLVGKAAEGYNDFYFTDDAYQNVKAVKDAMSVLDVKSKVQQAKIKFSKSVNEDFNKIIEQTTGIASEKRYSEAKAKVRGANKGNKKFFIPYSAEDFMGLIYPLLSKGKLGDSQMAWFKENLLNPYARAQENISADRLQLMEDFKTLKKALDVPKDLRKKTDSGFTKEQAVRVYLFNKAGFEVPGISKTDLNELLDLVNSDGVLKAFADQIFNITKGDGYAKPGENWLVGTITTDLIDVLNTVKRAKYLEQSGFTANAELIFSKENLNKLEAAYGTKYREAMENILGRMKSGKNRLFSGNRLSNRVLDYINNSTGAIMFFNTRSAVLQTISAINFLNWSFNNPIKAGAAFANQKQYWKDFVELINSDYLVDRRNGLKLNINESEIADAAATSKNKAKAALNYILQKGFLPTQYADSFAIASGGATFYRNRINDLVKNQNMSEADAKKQAILEWRETAEISQQSSDPSKISAQQASDLGRVILAFANTPMQYARIQKRALQDLVNRRGDAKTNVSKIIYYAVVQNLIFNALQSALFKLGFDEEEDDEKEGDKKEKMYLKTANGMLDSQLRGLGLAGATIAVIKNFLADIYERSGRDRPEYVDSVYELLRVSPPISSKISKLRQAAWQFDSKKRREEVFKKGFSIDNPAYEAAAKVISATTNTPLDRVYSKVDNISGAMSEDAETWQTIAMLAGWPKWQIMPKKEEVSTFNKGNVKIESKKKLEKKLGVKFL